jgi:hypothetical protein
MTTKIERTFGGVGGHAGDAHFVQWSTYQASVGDHAARAGHYSID